MQISNNVFLCGTLLSGNGYDINFRAFNEKNKNHLLSRVHYNIYVYSEEPLQNLNRFAVVSDHPDSFADGKTLGCITIVFVITHNL